MTFLDNETLLLVGSRSCLNNLKLLSLLRFWGGGSSWKAMHIPTGLLASVVACKNGVKRAHLVSAYIEGGLILELYSRDGIGCMISTDFYEVRHACSCLASSCHTSRVLLLRLMGRY